MSVNRYDSTTGILECLAGAQNGSDLDVRVSAIENKIPSNASSSNKMAVESEINDINDKIPSTASSSNQLVVESDLGTASAKDYTDNVEPNNHNLVESNAVYNAIANSISAIYKPQGNLTCAELTNALLIAANVGNVYNMTDSGTTSALFVQGAGTTINVNDTVGIIQTGVSEYKFNYMGNLIDLHGYQTKTLDTTLTIGGTQQTTVEGALGGLNSLVPSTASTSDKLVKQSDVAVKKNIEYTYTSATTLEGVIKEIFDNQLPPTTTDTNLYVGRIYSTHSGGGDMGSWKGYYNAEIMKGQSYRCQGFAYCQGRVFNCYVDDVVNGWIVAEVSLIRSTPKIVSYNVNVNGDANGNASVGYITEYGIPINFKPISTLNYPCIPFIDQAGNIYIRPLNLTWGANDYGTRGGINIQGTLYCIKV